MNRTELSPLPYLSRAFLAASTTSGCDCSICGGGRGDGGRGVGVGGERESNNKIMACTDMICISYHDTHIISSHDKHFVHNSLEHYILNPTADSAKK